MTTPVEISFTFNARPWTLNAERAGNRWQRADMVKQWRDAFHWLAKAQKAPQFNEVSVVVEVNMKRPLADTGNAYGSVKAAIDGLVDAGVLPDDGPEVISSLCMKAPRPTVKGQSESLTLTLIGVPI